jgi:hypothetical protein
MAATSDTALLFVRFIIDINRGIPEFDDAFSGTSNASLECS